MTNLDIWKSTLSNPFRDLVQLQRSMDRLVDGWSSPSGKNSTDVGFLPTVEVSETKNAFLFKFDLPGLTKEQIKIDLHENRLTVSGERKSEKGQEDKTHHMTEVAYGSFMRSFTLPTGIDSEKVEAKYENGVLNLSIPKVEASKARQITIN